MRTMALLLLLAATPALSQIRSDQALAPVVLGAAPPRQGFARVASDGTNFFVVWRMRSASNGIIIGGGRLSPAGELLDRPSILIASGTASTLGYPDVVFVGGNFLVVYQSGTSVLTRRFSRDGRPVDTQPVTISNSSMLASSMQTSVSGRDKPWLATNGKTVFLATAWNRFRLLAPDGVPLGAEHVIPNAGDGSMSVASNGDRYLIAYEYGPYPLHGTFLILDADGAFVLSGPIPVADSLGYVATASNGSSFLLCVSTGGIGTNPSTAISNVCTSIDAAGNTGVLNVIGVGKRSFFGPTMTWSGSEYTLAWARYEDGQVFGARVDATGALLDATPVLVGFSSSGVVFSYKSLDRYGVLFASAWNGRDTIIITGDIDQYGPSICYTTAAIFKSLPQIDAEPAARRHAAIASSAAEQAGGSIASNGTLSLVTWRESSGLGQAVVRAAFIAADGQLGAPIELGDAHFQTTTATASNGRDFLVAYYDPHISSAGSPGRLIARRVTLEGIRDSTPIVLPSNGDATDPIAIGWSGQSYVVLALVEYLNVWLSGVTPDGTVALSRQFYVTLQPPDSPAVSCAANGCSVTWHSATDLSKCIFECPYDENDVFVRTDATGNPVAQTLLTEDYPVTPALSLAASDGRSMFVYSNGKSMFAGRITAGGVVLDTPAVNGGRRVMTSETSFALRPLAVVNSGLYFVEPDSATAGRLYWTHIEPEPTPRVTSLINLHQSVTLPLTMTASSRNTYLLYSGGDDDPQLMASRLFLRTLASPDPQPGTPRRRSAR